MLQLNEQNRIPELDHCYICGELALSGELRPVRGALAIALEARKRRRECRSSRWFDASDTGRSKPGPQWCPFPG
jgi:predicted ATPase with chaperone activity